MSRSDPMAKHSHQEQQRQQVGYREDEAVDQHGHIRATFALP
jgi:hypothetical protein